MKHQTPPPAPVPPGTPRSRSQPVRSVWAHALVLLAAAAGVFLAGGPVQGSLGVFLLLAGVALIAFPAATKVGWGVWAAAGGIVACSALALLPAGWFPMPAWRATLAASPVIRLPSTISVVPHETAFWLGTMAISACVGLFLLSHPLRSRSLAALAAGGSAICALYGALAIYAQIAGWTYPFSGGASFGFFPNRNHTATLLLTGVMLALAVLGVAYRQRHWIAGGVATASMAVCVGALMLFSESRGGVVFAVVGALLWFGGLGQGHRDRRRIGYFAVFLLVAAGVLAGAGGSVRQRLMGSVPTLSEGGKGGTLTADARIVVFKDALRLLQDFPITGSGLGTFPLIFAQYEKNALSDFTSIHPESDWLMLADEAGGPAVICGVVFLGVALRRTARFRLHPYWPLRWGCIVAVLAALLHGLVDVPLHRVALGWWILVICGLAFQTGASNMLAPSRTQRALLLAAGLGALVMGGGLVRAEWFGGEPLAPFAARMAYDKSRAASDRQAYDEGYEIARVGYQQSPMAALLYYQAGALDLCFAGTEPQVDALFDAQRRLSPTWAAVPLMQARAWGPVDPSRAARMWTEALNRRQRIDRATNAGENRAVGLLTEAFSQTKTQPKLQELLLGEGARGRAFAFAAAEAASPEVAVGYLQKLTDDDGFLGGLSPAERGRFLKILETRGGAKMASDFLATHPEWKQPPAPGDKK